MQRREKRRGIVAVLVAISLVAILSIVAVTVDGGLMLEHRRKTQAAADAAALAAAADLYARWYTYQGLDTYGTARSSALSTAAANGYTNDTINSVVTVTFSPGTYQAGSQMGQVIPAGYVEVIVRNNQKRGFSGILGSGDLPVAGRAVARGCQMTSNVGILLLNPSASGALTLTGSSAMTVKGSVFVNSNNIKAAASSGSASLTANKMDLVGGYSSSNTSYFSASPLRTGQTAVSDFLVDVPAPDPSTIDDQGNPGVMTTRSNATYRPTVGQTLQPGVYIGGISIVSTPNVTFAPGIYYLKGGGLTMSGSSSSLTANGVMIYNGASSSGIVGRVTLSGGGRVVQSPPSTGTYAGISIFQDRTSTQPITLSGASGWNFVGTVYAPKALVSVSGAAGTTMGSQFIADTMTLSGSTNFNSFDPSKGYSTRDIRLIN